jgi:hypothetical protein
MGGVSTVSDGHDKAKFTAFAGNTAENSVPAQDQAPGQGAAADLPLDGRHSSLGLQLKAIFPANKGGRQGSGLDRQFTSSYGALLRAGYNGKYRKKKDEQQAARAAEKSRPSRKVHKN